MSSHPPSGHSQDLAEVWPDVEARLRALLTARGEFVYVDDIVQEVAARALETAVVFTDADDLYPWAATVARNLHVSRLRDQTRVVPTDAIPPQPSGEDVADVVHWRDLWTRTLTQIVQMPPQDQLALLAPATSNRRDPAGPEPVRASVRRHRARATLRRRLGDVLGALLPTGIGWRLLRRHGAVAISGAGVAVALVMAAGMTAPAPRAVPLTSRTQTPSVYLRPAPVPAHARERGATSPGQPFATRLGSSQRLPQDRHYAVQPARTAPGVRIDESHVARPKPLICLHGPAVDGICAPVIPGPEVVAPT